ncbi:MAG: pentapeptide repeat-containing protein [Actinomycetes bacterium]
MTSIAPISLITGLVTHEECRCCGYFERWRVNAGWHADPNGRHEYRYFDGTIWTEHVADAGVVGADPTEGAVGTPPSVPAPPQRPARPGAAAFVPDEAIQPGAYLFGVDLSGRDLSCRDLSGINLTGSNLTGASLNGSCLAGATMLRVRAARSTFAGADLTQANLSSARLGSADLSGACLIAATLQSVHMTKAKLDRARMARADFSPVRFTSGSWLQGASFVGTDLTDANLTKALLNRANLTSANLTRANLTKAQLRKATLVGAEMNGALLTRAELTHARLDGAQVAEADLFAARSMGRRQKPAARPIHTWADAEQAACDWMRWLGFTDAKLTPRGADGGADIVARKAVGQVKDWSGTVPIREVQRMAGVGAERGKDCAVLLFARTGYSSPAVQSAEKLRVALFTFSAAGEPSPVNSHARALVRRFR